MLRIVGANERTGDCRRKLTWRMIDTIPGWNADRLREMTELYGRGAKR